ncbi:MAG: helix-turn-helix domain-containing protein [Rhodocyclaceae bacterium]
MIAAKDQFFTLHGLVEETALPKPTLHRMLQRLEAAGMIQRDGDGRQYSTGVRLRRGREPAPEQHRAWRARHLVLRRLVEEVGELQASPPSRAARSSYLDRVETWPRRCASTCTPAHACRRTARRAASSSSRR